jgi:hypothetical protein
MPNAMRLGRSLDGRTQQLASRIAPWFETPRGGDIGDEFYGGEVKLRQQGTARARMRMARVWLTPEQYRQVEEGLCEVEAPAPGELLGQLGVAMRAACTAFSAAFDDAQEARRPIRV